MKRKRKRYNEDGEEKVRMLESTLVYVIKITKGNDNDNSVVVYGRCMDTGKKVLIIYENPPMYFFCRTDGKTKEHIDYLKRITCYHEEVKAFPLYGFTKDPYNFIKINHVGNGRLNKFNLERRYSTKVFESEFSNFDRFCLECGYSIGDYIFLSEMCEIKDHQKTNLLTKYGHTEFMLSKVDDVKTFFVSKTETLMDIKCNGLIEVPKLGVDNRGELLDACVNIDYNNGCIFKVITNGPQGPNGKDENIGSIYVLDVVTEKIRIFSMQTNLLDDPKKDPKHSLTLYKDHVDMLLDAITCILSFDYVLGWKLYDDKNQHTLNFILKSLEEYVKDEDKEYSESVKWKVKNIIKKNRKQSIRPNLKNCHKQKFFSPKYENIATISSVVYIDLFLFFKEYYDTVKPGMNSSKQYIGPFTHSEHTLLCNFYGKDYIKMNIKTLNYYFRSYSWIHYPTVGEKVCEYLRKLRKLVTEKDVIGMTIQRAKEIHSDIDLVWTRGQSFIFKMIFMNKITEMRNLSKLIDKEGVAYYVNCNADFYNEIKDPNRYTKNGSRRGGAILEPSYVEVDSDIITMDYASNYINTIIESKLGFSNIVMSDNFKKYSKERINKITVGTVELGFVQLSMEDIELRRVLPFIQLVKDTLLKRKHVKELIAKEEHNDERLKKLKAEEKAIKKCLVSITGCISRTKYMFSNLAVGETMRHVARYKFNKAVKIVNKFPLNIRELNKNDDDDYDDDDMGITTSTSIEYEIKKGKPEKESEAFCLEVIHGHTDGFDFIMRRGTPSARGEMVCGGVKEIEKIAKLLNKNIIKTLKRKNYGFERNFLLNDSEGWKKYCKLHYKNDKLSIEYLSSAGLYFNSTTKILKRHLGYGDNEQSKIIYKSTYNKDLQNSWVERKMYEKFVKYYFKKMQTSDEDFEEKITKKIESIKKIMWGFNDKRLFKRFVRYSINRHKLMLTGDKTSDVLVTVLRQAGPNYSEIYDDYGCVQLDQMVPYFYGDTGKPISIDLDGQLSKKKYLINVESECNNFI